MYDNGYVRLTALRRGGRLFSQRFALLFPPLKGGRGDVPLRSETVYHA